MAKFTKETNDIIKSDSLHSCLTCGCPTYYIEVYSEGYFCSDECLDDFYKIISEQEKYDYGEE